MLLLKYYTPYVSKFGKLISVHRLKQVSFHSNPKEGQCQKMFKLLCNCAHFTCQQSNVQNPSIQTSAVCEPRTSIRTNWVQKRQRNQRANCRLFWIIGKAIKFQKNISCFIGHVKAFDCVDHNKLQKILIEMGIPDHFTCLLRNLYVGKEATIRNRQ